ncbi:hypothetical protein [Kribbella jejuensis]|nr:hypothetical protein [Kribbella jejuensis]
MLSNRGYLSGDEERFRRTTNAWYDATYINPSTVDPSIYADNPDAASWFKPTAHHLFEPIPGYLEILAAHNVPCRRYTSPSPGRVLYEDPHQLVVVPADQGDPVTTMLWLRPRT